MWAVIRKPTGTYLTTMITCLPTGILNTSKVNACRIVNTVANTYHIGFQRKCRPNLSGAM